MKASLVASHTHSAVYCLWLLLYYSNKQLWFVTLYSLLLMLSSAPCCHGAFVCVRMPLGCSFYWGLGVEPGASCMYILCATAAPAPSTSLLSSLHCIKLTLVLSEEEPQITHILFLLHPMGNPHSKYIECGKSEIQSGPRAFLFATFMEVQ